MEKFIKTTDSVLAEKLKASGMKLISNNNGIFTFLNEGNLPMLFADNTKIIFSNKIEF